MLAFVDLETTGLSPEKHKVLEVACIITNDALEEIARYETIVNPWMEFYELDEFIRDMHTRNGLWSLVHAGADLFSADCSLAAFIREHAVKIGPDDKGKIQIDRPQLAGNTIGFDRAFMKKHLPNAEAELHYRNLDLTSFNEMSRRFNKQVYDSRPRNPGVAHRAMADAEESLKLARHYAQAMISGLVM